MRQLKTKFTLIELLVVIVIITILAGMLLPALSGAKETARNITCTSNLKTVGQALVLYADTYNDKLPRTFQKQNGTALSPDFGSTAIWQAHLMAFSLNYSLPSGVTEYGWKYRNYYFGTGSPFTCPSVKNAISWRTQTSDLTGNTYEYTMCSKTGVKHPSGYMWDGTVNSYSKIPGKSVIIYEKTTPENSSNLSSYGTNTTAGNANIQVLICTDSGYNKGGNSPGFRHRKKANLLRADGAVLPLAYGTTVNNDWTF